jgi:hypothetical protein
MEVSRKSLIEGLLFYQICRSVLLQLHTETVHNTKCVFKNKDNSNYNSRLFVFSRMQGKIKYIINLS